MKMALDAERWEIRSCCPQRKSSKGSPAVVPVRCFRIEGGVGRGGEEGVVPCAQTCAAFSFAFSPSQIPKTSLPPPARRTESCRLFRHATVHCLCGSLSCTSPPRSPPRRLKGYVFSHSNVAVVEKMVFFIPHILIHPLHSGETSSTSLVQLPPTPLPPLVDNNNKLCPAATAKRDGGAAPGTCADDCD